MEMMPVQHTESSNRERRCVRAVVLRPERSILLQIDGVTEENADDLFLQVVQNMYRDLHHTSGLRGAQVFASHYTAEHLVVIFEEWQTQTHLQQALLQHEWQSAFNEIQTILARSATVLGPYLVTLAEEQESHVYENPSLPPNFADIFLPAPLGEHLSKEEIAVLQQATGTTRKAIMQALFADVMS